LTTVQNVLPGTYALQVMDGGRLVNTVPVTIVDGQETTIEV
jgi:hypothetical protein